MVGSKIWLNAGVGNLSFRPPPKCFPVSGVENVACRRCSPYLENVSQIKREKLQSREHLRTRTAGLTYVYIYIYIHTSPSLRLHQSSTFDFLLVRKWNRKRSPVWIIEERLDRKRRIFLCSGRATFFQRSSGSSSNGTLVEACSVQASWVSVKNSSDIRCRWHYFGTRSVVFGRLWGSPRRSILLFARQHFSPPPLSRREETRPHNGGVGRERGGG